MHTHARTHTLTRHGAAVCLAQMHPVRARQGPAHPRTGRNVGRTPLRTTMGAALIAAACLATAAAAFPVDSAGARTRPAPGSACVAGVHSDYERFIAHCGAPFRVEHCYCGQAVGWVCTAAMALPCAATTPADSAAVHTATPPGGPPAPRSPCSPGKDRDYERFIAHCGAPFRVEHCYCGQAVGWVCTAAMPLPCATSISAVEREGQGQEQEQEPPVPGSACSMVDAGPHERWIGHCGSRFRVLLCYCAANTSHDRKFPGAWVCLAAVAPPCQASSHSGAADAAAGEPSAEGCTVHENQLFRGAADGPAASGAVGGWSLARCTAVCMKDARCAVALYSPTATGLTPSGFCELWTGARAVLELEGYAGVHAYACGSDGGGTNDHVDTRPTDMPGQGGSHHHGNAAVVLRERTCTVEHGVFPHGKVLHANSSLFWGARDQACCHFGAPLRHLCLCCPAPAGPLWLTDPHFCRLVFVSDRPTAAARALLEAGRRQSARPRASAAHLVPWPSTPPA